MLCGLTIMDETDPVQYAGDLKSLGVNVGCRRYQHEQPCGPRGDRGPRDDFGRRWHWCYEIAAGDKVFTGRRSEAIAYLDLLGEL